MFENLIFMSWEDVSYVVRSKTRKSILIELKTPKTPSLLASALKTSIPNASRALKQLRKRQMVICLTPDERTGRIYALTDKGKEVLEKIVEMNKQPPSSRR